MNDIECAECFEKLDSFELRVPATWVYTKELTIRVYPCKNEKCPSNKKEKEDA